MKLPNPDDYADHTPGPWMTQKMRQEGMWQIGIGTFWIAGLIGEANACLIAAAPELLAVCEKLAMAQSDSERLRLRDDAIKAINIARRGARGRGDVEQDIT